ncbi:hypothetical protein EYF80_035604 [Liparis tanakae]|uniref:Uncharacterized protein n=1 Tax=Liparis tanakae TaxID=230148 RepID=A0A4Z2GL20_9TELE|nr:hypothetical protein EYF80_035604 [Liparis tanakae]
MRPTPTHRPPTISRTVLRIGNRLDARTAPVHSRHGDSGVNKPTYATVHRRRRLLASSRLTEEERKGGGFSTGSSGQRHIGLG